MSRNPKTETETGSKMVISEAGNAGLIRLYPSPSFVSHVLRFTYPPSVCASGRNVPELEFCFSLWMFSLDVASYIAHWRQIMNCGFSAPSFSSISSFQLLCLVGC
jgi:hypothetical protein